MGQNGSGMVRKKKWFNWWDWGQLFWVHFLVPTTDVWWLEGRDCWWDCKLCWVH